MNNVKLPETRVEPEVEENEYVNFDIDIDDKLNEDINDSKRKRTVYENGGSEAETLKSILDEERTQGYSTLSELIKEERGRYDSRFMERLKKIFGLKGEIDNSVILEHAVNRYIGMTDETIKDMQEDEQFFKKESEKYKSQLRKSDKLARDELTKCEFYEKQLVLKEKDYTAKYESREEKYVEMMDSDDPEKYRPIIDKLTEEVNVIDQQINRFKDYLEEVSDNMETYEFDARDSELEFAKYKANLDIATGNLRVLKSRKRSMERILRNESDQKTIYGFYERLGEAENLTKQLNSMEQYADRMTMAVLAYLGDREDQAENSPNTQLDDLLGNSMERSNKRREAAKARIKARMYNIR